MFFFCRVTLSILFLLVTTTQLQAQMIEINLPQPEIAQGKNLRQDIQQRRSIRNFNVKKDISLKQLSLLLWATYGKQIKDIDTITSATYTVPSAGAIYALEIFAVVGKGAVKNMQEGLYRYVKEKHSLTMLSNTDIRKALAEACLGQGFIQDAPILIVIAINTDSMSRRYGNRAERYAILEAGHAAQNLYLICSDIGLATVEVGAFIDKEVSKVLDIPYTALLIMPVGYELIE